MASIDHTTVQSQTLTVGELCDMYVHHAKTTWRKPSTGERTTTWYNVQSACSHLRSTPIPDSQQPPILIGELPAADMSARILFAVQVHLVGRGDLARQYINDTLRWIRTMFRWAAHPMQQLVPEEVPVKLSLVGGIKAGRSTARESEPVTSVPFYVVMSTAEHASELWRTCMLVHWQSGMRPGEVVNMQWSRIDTSTKPWIYRPTSHKTEHHGKRRTIPLNAEAQAILKRWRKKVGTDVDYVFEGSHLGVPTGRPVLRTSYSTVIRRICLKHRIPHWHPNQIRHAFATRVEQKLGMRATQKLLGHSNVVTTQKYLDADELAVIAIGRDL